MWIKMPGVFQPPSVRHVGLTISRDSATQLEIATGTIWDNVGNPLIVSLAITLDLTVSGDFVNGSARATNAWYHVLVGRSSGSIVAGLSTTLAKPSAWSSWQQIGAIQTNATGSGGLVIFVQNGDRFIFADDISAAAIFFDLSFGPTEEQVRAWCPPGVYDTQSLARVISPSTSVYFATRQISGGNASNPGYLKSADAQSLQLPTLTDSSGKFYLVLSGAATFTDFAIYPRDFTYPIGQAEF